MSDDIWKQWLLHRRDPSDRNAAMVNAALRPIRDKVLDSAKIVEGETLLDLGTGTGLVAFGAVERVGERGSVIFSDISQDCLDHCRTFAEQLKLDGRCKFINAGIEDLSELSDRTANVVTARSVIIYIRDKQRAFNEIFRVMRRMGRLSIFEPINSFSITTAEESSSTFKGYDVEPIAQIAARVRQALLAHQAEAQSTLTDFDERDLMRFALNAGFESVELELTAEVAPSATMSWEFFYRSAPNPLALTVEEAARHALDEQEQKSFEAYLRPVVESTRVVGQRAGAFMVATKGWAGVELME